MNSLLKRMGTGLLVFLMVFSLVVAGLPADTFAATGTYTYNTGSRHDYDVSLSSQALDYYTGDYTWDKLSALDGGNESCLDTDNPLFEALHDLMADTMTNSVSYSSLPTYWAKTDASAGATSYILFYSDVAGPNSSMNREHVWPKSHGSFKEKNAGCDLHHLRPTVGNVNSARGNLIMGNVQGKSGASTYSYNGTVVLYKTSSLCEVNDNIKGDVARILLYVWCRWEEPNLFMNTSNPVIGPSDDKNDGGKVIESLETLLEWCAIDPVDTWEMSRNDQVENVQGNRNVFIDYPEFAWLVFGKDVPTDLDTPSNNAAGGVSGNPSGSGSTGGSTGGTAGGSTGGSTSGSATSNYTQLSALNDGDKVVIVNPASNMALSATKDGYYNIGVDVSGGFANISDAEIYTAKKNSDGTWSFTSASGKKLALGAEYSSLNESGANDRWELSSAGTNQFYLKNTGRDLYLEWYAEKGNWSAYNPEALSTDYVLAFYKEVSAGSSGTGSTGGTTGGTTTTTPPTSQPSGGTPATTPPASQPSGDTTTPPTSQPDASEGTGTPATDGAQQSAPATSKPTQPAPLPFNSVEPPTLVGNPDPTPTFVIIAIVVVAAVAGGLALWFFVIKPKKDAAAKAAPAEEIPEETPAEPAEETPAEPTEETSENPADENE